MPPVAFAASPPVAPRTASAIAWSLAFGLTVGITLARSVIPIIWTHQFNADEAIFGLMATHLVDGRAFPLFMYGSPYMLGAEAWAAAPFFAIAGPSVAALKLPLLVANIAIAWLLFRILHKDAGLTPAAALVASLPFTIAAPFVSIGTYMEVSGGNVEPCLYVLLLWMLRHRPWWFGLVLGLGFAHRQFTAYGAAALLCLQAMDRSLLRKATLERWLIVALAVALVWEAIALLRVWSSPMGPGTSWTADDRAAFDAAAGFACVAPSTFAGGMRAFVVEGLPLMLGLETQPRLAAALAIALVLGFVRIVWVSTLMRGAQPVLAQSAPSAYIALVGLFSVTGYVALRCGTVNPATLRYALLAPFLFVGLAALFFRLEPSRWGRLVAALVVVAWAIVPAAQHAALVRGYLREPPAHWRSQLARHLESRGIRHAIGDYWDAYVVTFLSREQVRVASDTHVRITEYQDEFDRQPGARWRISRRPCPAGGYEAVPGAFWMCPISP